ncbi:MAG: SocA family protein [Synergistaceae bacterium]|nr:SocA family protein [Synergistaceae bacterium]
MFNVQLIADFFLSKSDLSPKKLQKLLYYAYCWVLALLNENPNHIHVKLFHERIEAWVHGPVIPSVYKFYKSYGADNIPHIDNFDTSIFPYEVLDILNQVWDVYGQFSGNQLETISHKQSPWILARNDLPPYEPSDNLISDYSIFCYFNEQANQ